MSIFLSIFPILLLIVLMIGVKLPGDKSAVLAVLSAVLIAIFAVPNVSGFPPPQGYGASYVGWAFVEGILKAVFPILIIILMALFSYNILLESKQIEVIKQQFTNISSDKRIQVLLIVWGFGGLLEGMAGFGTAVAIPAAILIGLGFAPRFAALVSLIGNSVATGFGVILAMSFWTAFWVALIWATIAFKFKKSSLAALVAAVCAPFTAFIVIQHPYHPSWGWSLVVVSALVIVRHRDNIKRMQAGNEPDVGNTAAPAQPANPVAPVAEQAPKTEPQKVEQVVVLQKNARQS